MATTKKIEDHLLPEAGPGCRRAVRVIRYGRSEGPKAYLQAGLHADEAPGRLVMHHLIQILDQADRDGQVTGEIVLVPVANPIGASQWRGEKPVGRFDFNNHLNFNRGWPDLADELAERVRDGLGPEAEANISLIRRETAALIKAANPADETEHLKLLLLQLAHDADVVLDLHCDYQAVVHLYLGPALWPEAEDLAARIGSEATLLAADSGTTPFDESCARTWWKLADRFPELPIPPACLAATVELRGESDLSHDLARTDAQNLFYFFQGRGLIAGRPPDRPPLLRPATPLTGVEQLTVHSHGVLVYLKKPGDWVDEGEIVAEVVNPLAENPPEAVIPVPAGTSGVMYSRLSDRFARPGRIIARIAGEKPLKKEGENLLTT